MLSVFFLKNKLNAGPSYANQVIGGCLKPVTVNCGDGVHRFLHLNIHSFMHLATALKPDPLLDEFASSLLPAWF